jgi:energy-coupling factor transporter ATP-binding protein EcfA2
MAISLKASEQGLEQIDGARRTKGWSKADEAWAESAQVAIAGLKRFWRGSPIRRDTFISICEAVGIDWQVVADLPFAQALPPNQIAELASPSQPDWQTLSREMFAAHRQLTTNPLTLSDGQFFDNFEDVYQPVALQERLHRPRRKSDVLPKDGSELYDLDLIDAPNVLEQQQFFYQVLAQGKSRKSKGKRIAIVGHPGAGKSTQLQKIAEWVFEQTRDEFVIWVSLANLHGKDLETYILEDWLKEATGRIQPELELQQALVDQVQQGRVWLLLDGVDEMLSDTSSPLAVLARQFSGWLRNARIVLTCRLNVWDAGKNPLAEFDVYQSLEFRWDKADPTLGQVGGFIRKWFAGQPALGNALCAELQKSENQLLQDVVRNPLRLAMLCRIWARQSYGQLPRTKVALYEQFAEALYEWKQDRFPTTPLERQQLNQALGELALKAFAEKNAKYPRQSGFRLSSTLVRENLSRVEIALTEEQSLNPGSALGLALQIGWLNQIGVAAEDPNEIVYAFFHPSFQEYFAVQVILENPLLFGDRTSDAHYLIHELAWDDLIQQWLQPEAFKNPKLNALTDALVEQLQDEQTDENTRCRIAQAFGKIGDALIVITVLTALLGSFHAEDPVGRNYTRCQAAGSLLKRAPSDRNAKQTLLGLLKLNDPILQEQAAEQFAFAEPGDPEVIIALKTLRETSSVGTTQQRAIESFLKQMGIQNPEQELKRHSLQQSTEDPKQRLKRYEQELLKKDPGLWHEDSDDEEIDWFPSDQWEQSPKNKKGNNSSTSETTQSDKKGSNSSTSETIQTKSGLKDSRTLDEVSSLIAEAIKSPTKRNRIKPLIRKEILRSPEFGRDSLIPADYEKGFEQVMEKINQKIDDRTSSPNHSDVRKWLDPLLQEYLTTGLAKSYQDAANALPLQSLPAHHEITRDRVAYFRRQRGETWETISSRRFPGIPIFQLRGLLGNERLAV